MSTDPHTLERVLPDLHSEDVIDDEGPYVVILYNDDYHEMMEVVAQLQKATGYDFNRCVQIMWEAHTRGRAIAYTGSQDDCERAASVLRQIRLQVETDKF
ncbi:MAG: ATP-dependent Clp protease adaptor ClpS [Chloroherpetonaceae bacterium]|nr:ATP-dependent Clp protease adaptor ClpS [Chthonomonadaceae bacterium]MDW8209071.1 ATP-dependent Clp protease adaptor ClpS [Chloroherpetonaceae bacterium]